MRGRSEHRGINPFRSRRRVTRIPSHMTAAAASPPTHHDAYVTEVVVVVESGTEQSFDDILAKCKSIGLDVREVRKDDYVIEGCIESSKLVDLDKLPGVKYVRSVFTYVADYPPGDPRDQDRVHREVSQD